MFKIESYIAPLLMGYVDKYVQLKQEDFQLSLWGGDVVLNNLDLRLDVLQKALQLPVMFKSGQVRELRIHVPWTKLGSEPVVITINTVECILKVRDTAYGDSSSTKSGETQRKVSQQSRGKLKAKKPDPADDLPPGYLQSLMNRIVNNVNIIINNLIIKFVEDDIVFSLNAKSAECYSTDMQWNRAFIDLTPSDLVLRKVINICDLTVCLDKTNASGRIERYQEPFLYRCSVSSRLHMTYDSVNAKMPNITKFNVSCERLDLSLSDTQLPMFIRLLELCIAIYYGTLDFSQSETEQEKEPDKQEVARTNETSTDVTIEGEVDTEEGGEGWVSWAWSFVPQILPEEEDAAGGRLRDKQGPPILSVGFYVHQASLTFKLSEKVKQDSSSQYSSYRVLYHPFLYLDSEGLSTEILMQGINFFDAQCGITTLRVATVGMCICGAKDEGDPRSMILFQGGESLLNKTVMNYMSKSLFDAGSPENQDSPPEYICDRDKHIALYTEQYGLQKYGAFWFDYLYFMALADKKPGGSKSSVSEESSVVVFFPETSVMKCLIGPCHLNVSSSLYHRVQKFLHCAADHQYQPYGSVKEYDTEEDRPDVTEDQVTQMEEFIPTRTRHFTLIQPSVSILAAEHDQCDVAKKTYRPGRKKNKDSKHSVSSLSKFTLPAGRMSASRFDFQVVSPMYPFRLVRLVSNIAGPSSNLLYHCHSHTQIKVFNLHAGVVKVDPGGVSSHLVTIVPPCSVSVYSKYLVLPKYWTNAYLPVTEWLYEVPQISVNLTKASLLLMGKTVSSWLQKDPRPSQFADDTLLGDIFPESEGEKSFSLPVLEIAVSGCEMKCCSTGVVDAYTGSVTSAQVVLYSKDFESKENRVVPIFTGPANTSSLHSKTFFEQEACRTDILRDCISFTVQLPKKRNVSEAPGVILVNVEGCVASLDPSLGDWLMYTPRSQPSFTVSSRRDDRIKVDLALAQATSPLQTDISQVSVHSSSSQTNPTRPVTQSQTQTASQVISPKDVEEKKGKHSKSPDGLGAMMAELFPLIKMLHIQAEVRSSCIFFPDNSMVISEPSMDIPVNFHTAFQSNNIPNTLLLCLPSITVQSSGIKPMSVVQEIPITSLDGSLIGDKLPWSVKLEKLTLYTLHTERMVFSLFKPLSIASTVAFSCKYSPPASDNITSLGLCLHVDIQPATVALSKVQTQLCTSVIKKTMSLVDRGTSFAFHLLKLIQPKDSTSVKPVRSFSVEKKVESTLSFDNDFVVTEQSEDTTSRDGASPIHKVDLDDLDVNGVKLSFWTQFLLPRMDIQLFGENKIKAVESCLSAVAEDMAVSLDIQQVYSKVKATLGSFNISLLQKSGESWEKGPFEGILLSCRSELPRDTVIVTNKLWTAGTHTVTHMFPSPEGLQREPSNAFLNFTFTKALCKSVSKKMKRMNIELSELAEMETESSFDELYFHDYISEICLKTEPCDVVLYMPVCETLMNILNYEGEESGTPKQITHRLNLHQAHSKRKPSPPQFSSSNLPLIYANIGSVRFILPDPEAEKHKPSVSQSGNAAGDSREIHQDQKNEEKSEPKVNTTLDHDMLVAQFQSIAIQPRADNPLPRESVEKDLYRRALQAGLTQHPGSSVEDRQYQVNLKGLSLCTGWWDELVKETKFQGNYKPPVSPGVQIPALEWNTFLSLQQQEKEDIRLIPIASAFDLCLVMAPAVVYTRRNTGDGLERFILVCGYAAEMNVTSDLDLYLSTSQVHLVSQLAQKCQENLSTVTKQETGDTLSVNARSSLRGQEHLGIDSGVESDISTITLEKSRFVKSASSSKFGSSAGLGLRSKVMPFNVLLTAGRISCTLYSHINLQADCPATSKASQIIRNQHASKHQPSPKGDKTMSSNLPSPDSNDSYLLQYDTCPDLDVLKTEEEPEKKLIPAGSVCVKPFLYLYLAQPHTIISCSSASQRFEMSCYDVIAKGPSEKDIIPVDEQHLLPDRADFSSYWMETRAGRPNPKTGIPPSLYTLQITDFLKPAAHVTLKFERPIKINLSLNKMDQVHCFLREITPVSSSAETVPEPSLSESTLEETVMTSGPGILSKLGHVEVVTDQLMAVMDAATGDEKLGLLLSSSMLKVMANLQHANHGVSDVLGCEVFLKDVMAKTVFEKKTRTFLGPASVNLDMSFIWCQHSGPPTVPRVVFAFETGTVPIYFGQEHAVCFQMLAEKLRKFSEKNSEPRLGSKSMQRVESKEATSVSSHPELIQHPSKDDLRMTGFQYVVDHDGSGLEPRPGEIVFSDSNTTEDGNSTMTWMYHRPRVLTHVSVLPVPFGLSSEDKPDKVPCILQYWDQTSQQFLGYIDFHITENETFTLPLPEVKVINHQELIVSQIWRVVINRSVFDDEEKEKNTTERRGRDCDSLVLPASLAACMSVDSCFIPSLIPVVQGCVSTAGVQLHLVNHGGFLGSEVPTRLSPFMLASPQADDQEFAVLTLDDVSASFSHLLGQVSRSEIQLAMAAGFTVLEYKSLTMDPVLEPTLMDGYLVSLHTEKPPMSECNCKIGSAVVRVGRGTVHTLTTSLQAWSRLFVNDRESCAQLVFNHIIICNDTQHTIRFGQVGTDENLPLASRTMYPYSWRSHKSKQLLHMCMDHPSWKWCDPFDINTETSLVRNVKAKDQVYTVIIKIKQLTNNQKQIIISGQFVVSSRLSQHLEVCLMMSGGDKSVKDNLCIMGGCRTVPSYVVEPEEIVGIKFRIPGQKTAWCQEIHVSGDKMKENTLIKIPLEEKSSYIHVWCRIFCQHFKDRVQTLVLLMPLYILRSHLPRPLYVDMETPRLQLQQQLQVSGQANEYQLHCVGGDITHNLAFRLGPCLPKSSPPLVLSTGLIDQVERNPLKNVDIDQLCYDQPVDPAVTWPYCFPDLEGPVPGSGSNGTRTSCMTDGEDDLDQPSVDLNINLSEYMPGCSTLLVDITPWCLLTNLSGIPIVLLMSGKQVEIPHGRTFSPPAFEKNEFCLGIHCGDKLLTTNAIPISDDEVANKRYSPDLGRVLFVDGCVHSTIRIPGECPQGVFLTVNSEMKQDMRIVTIREKFGLTNLSPAEFEMRLLALPFWTSKVNWLNFRFPQPPEVLLSHESKKKSEENVQSLLTWNILGQENEDAVVASYVHYIALREKSDEMNSKWSLPLRIAATSEGVRLSVSVPNMDSDGSCTVPYCISSRIHQAVTYLVLAQDTGPICVVTNNCSFPLLFGQALTNITLSGTVVQEETELISDIPTLDPGSSSHYTMPHVNTQYPATDAMTYPMMHFCARLPQEDGSTTQSSWSCGVDVMTTSSTFVKLSGVADVKVQTEKVAMVTYVKIEPISKAEISAKEIRSRLKGAKSRTKVMDVTPTVDENVMLGVDVSRTESKVLKKSHGSSSVYSVGIFFQDLSLVMLDETTSTEEVSEILKLYCDQVFIAHFPVNTSADRVESKSCISLSVGTVQLDNQQYGQGQYDFPVLLVEQASKKESMPDMEKMTVTEKHAVLRLSSFLHTQMVLTVDDSGASVTESIEVAVTPLSLYLDDTFIYRLLREVEGFIPNALHYEVQARTKVKRLPDTVHCSACALSRPLRVHYLSIQPISMLLSVHASLKLFLASDHTPLSFSKFEKKNLYTSSHQLTRALAMHYASGAIFRAGIVVGSLEILGNPTGLVRSIGTGVADMFRLPYAGLTRGPGAFIGGVSRGMTSLLKNVSAGMITSVTNFASSVSRNMDRLSLDTGHLQRQEENRRNHPVGVSDGLLQGLTGFGLSLLGAVAGLADQPIQSLISQSESERRVSRSAAATGLAAGLGKGLVGVVTKPIGGAAEFVSQTGQGILHGTGLGQLPRRRNSAVARLYSQARNGVYKYTQKIFSSLPSTEVLMAVESLHLDLTGTEVEVILLLTPEILFVVSCEEDAQQQAFAVSELEVSECPSDSSLITIVWNDNYYKTAIESETSNKERVAAFIDSAPTLAQPIMEEASASDSQSESLSPGNGHFLVPQYQFRISPCSRELFITMFELTKNNLQGRGFPV